MIYWLPSNMSSQKNFQYNYYQLYQHFTLIQNQINQIYQQNHFLQQSILQINKKTTQIQLQLTHKLNQNVLDHVEVGTQELKKKTNKFSQSSAEILSESKQCTFSQNHKKEQKRSKNQIKNFTCPYDQCQRTYKSSFSLNLHIKIHHNGGSKRQRQKYASIILQAQQKGQLTSQIPIKLPPGFLQVKIDLKVVISCQF